MFLTMYSPSAERPIDVSCKSKSVLMLLILDKLSEIPVVFVAMSALLAATRSETASNWAWVINPSSAVSKAVILPSILGIEVPVMVVIEASAVISLVSMLETVVVSVSKVSLWSFITTSNVNTSSAIEAIGLSSVTAK